jgi:hypothetical protein
MNVGAHWQEISRSRCAGALALVGILTLYFIVVPRPSEPVSSSPSVTAEQPSASGRKPAQPVVPQIEFDGVKLPENRLRQAPEMPEARPFSTDLIDQKYKPDFDPGLLR